MRRSISPMQEETIAGSDPRIAPRLIVPMSLQLVIPRRVALQQSSPPLHQPSIILKEKKKFEKEKPVNGKCANSKLSQRRGSPHQTVPKLCQNSRLWGLVVLRQQSFHWLSGSFSPELLVSSSASFASTS